MRLWLLSLLAGTAIECIEAIALPAAAQGGLSLAVYNNTVLAGAPVTATIQELNFNLPLNGSAGLSAQVTGTMHATAGGYYRFNCSFGVSTWVSLHVDDHLVCQFGANVDGKLIPGQGSKAGCGGGSDHTSCAGVDNPLAVMTRTQLPVRLSVMYNPTVNPTVSKVASELMVSVDIISEERHTFSTSLSALEQQRRSMQSSLLQGWGLVYDMGYTDQVHYPSTAALPIPFVPAPALPIIRVSTTHQQQHCPCMSAFHMLLL